MSDVDALLIGVVITALSALLAWVIRASPPEDQHRIRRPLRLFAALSIAIGLAIMVRSLFP
jgi:hypothetical protein